MKRRRPNNKMRYHGRVPKASQRAQIVAAAAAVVAVVAAAVIAISLAWTFALVTQPVGSRDPIEIQIGRKHQTANHARLPYITTRSSRSSQADWRFYCQLLERRNSQPIDFNHSHFIYILGHILGSPELDAKAKAKAKSKANSNSNSYSAGFALVS